MKVFKFEVRLDNGRKRIYSTTSKHLNGAVRKLYQEHNFEEIVRIL